MTSRPLLAGVRVIDLSQYIPGPFATRQLADLGADVIKIEPPGGDPMQHFMATENDEPSPVYRHINRGKRICRVDLKQDDGQRILAGLLENADILLESFRPGVLARLGFDRDRLDAINPRLIHCALSGFGHTGPYAQRAGHDINYCALAGQSLVSGTAERPVIGFPPIADHASAQQAAIAMLAALHGRENRDGGIFLDISISESILAWQYLPALGGASERAASILDGGAACYNIYRCADGRFVSLGAIEQQFWENFCIAVTKPEWTARQFESMPQQALIGELAALFATQPRDHWQARLDGIDCCFEVLLADGDLAAQPQFAFRAAIDADGPRYPAWIDGRAIETGTEPRQISSPNDLDWHTPLK
jgi:crotonobetainyl-CoA:carnitine CoA-transferase CaiB-like acyl-CoA transferase